MARYIRFTFLVDKQERAVIRELAQRLARSESDAVRYVVTAAVRELGRQDYSQPATSDAANVRA